jgi:hypothetical protein
MALPVAIRFVCSLRTKANIYEKMLRENKAFVVV